MWLLVLIVCSVVVSFCLFEEIVERDSFWIGRLAIARAPAGRLETVTPAHRQKKSGKVSSHVGSTFIGVGTSGWTGQIAVVRLDRSVMGAYGSVTWFGILSGFVM